MGKYGWIKVAIVVSLCCNSLYISAQQDKGRDVVVSTNSTILRNDPENVPRLNIAINPLGINYTLGNNAGIGGGVAVAYKINQKINVFGSAYTSYQIPKFAPPATEGKPTAPLSWHNLEIGGNYFITSKMINNVYNVKTESRGNGGGTYAILKANYLRKFGFRFGYSATNTIISARETPGTVAGRPLEGYDVTDVNQTKTDLYGKISTNMATNLVFAGISLETVRDLLVKLDKYPNREFEETRNIQLYIDLMYATSIKYDDVTILDNQNNINPGVYKLNSYMPKYYTGARFGIKYQPLTDINTNFFGWKTYGLFETGIMPGNSSGLFFISLGAGASFGFLRPE